MVTATAAAVAAEADGAAATPSRIPRLASSTPKPTKEAGGGGGAELAASHSRRVAELEAALSAEQVGLGPAAQGNTLGCDWSRRGTSFAAFAADPSRRGTLPIAGGTRAALGLVRHCFLRLSRRAAWGG